MTDKDKKYDEASPQVRPHAYDFWENMLVRLLGEKGSIEYKRRQNTAEEKRMIKTTECNDCKHAIICSFQGEFLTIDAKIRDAAGVETDVKVSVDCPHFLPIVSSIL